MYFYKQKCLKRHFRPGFIVDVKNVVHKTN